MVIVLFSYAWNMRHVGYVWLGQTSVNEHTTNLERDVLTCA